MDIDSRLPEGIKIFGLVGGPGSGKSTQGKLLAENHGITHISIGEVLRKEQARPGSPYAEIIREKMMTGQVGPIEITVPILRDHIAAAAEDGARAFVLDGFPRSMEQCQLFEEIAAPITLIVYLDCPERTCIQRIQAAQRLDRFDDTADNIKRRIETFNTQTKQVIDSFHYRREIWTVESGFWQSIDVVRKQIETGIAEFGVLKEENCLR